MEEKNIKSSDVGCVGCGATMRYSPERQKLFCDNCETTKDIEFNKIAIKHLWAERDKATKSTKEWASQTKSLKCPNCGASVVLNKLEYSQNCPYCETALVGRSDEIEEISPDGIIPFKFSDLDASNKYVAGIKKKFFVPNAFKKAPPTENIKGVYIPCFSYDADTTSAYRGTLATDHRYTDKNGRSYTKTTYRNISGIHKQQNIDVIVETSSKLNQAQLQKILPFNMSDVVGFKQAFIMGYAVEHYESTVNDCKEVSNRIMEESIKKNILSKYSYDRVSSFSMETSYENEKYMYYLLPTYKCDYMYKNKKYTTFMNGQTGKVGGGYPKSPVKITFFVLFLIAIFAGIIALGMLAT